MAIHLNVYIRARKRTQKNKNWKGIDFFFFFGLISIWDVSRHVAWWWLCELPTQKIK